MKVGTRAVVDVLKDTVVIPMTRVTAKMTSAPKSVKPDVNVIPVTHVIMLPDTVFPKPNVLTVHGALTMNILAIALIIVTNQDAVVHGVKHTMALVIKGVPVTKVTCVITSPVCVFQWNNAGFKNVKIMIRSQCGSKINATTNFIAAMVNSADSNDQSLLMKLQRLPQLQRQRLSVVVAVVPEVELVLVLLLVLLELLAGPDVPVNQVLHGILISIDAYQNKTVSLFLNVLKARFGENVNTVVKTHVPNLDSVTEVLPLIQLETLMKVGLLVQSVAVSVPKELFVITIPMVLAVVLTHVKKQCVAKMNSGTPVHLLVVISIVKALTNVETITMLGHVSNGVRVLTDLFATGTLVSVSNKGSVLCFSVQNILGSPTVVPLVTISFVALVNIVTCPIASRWVAVQCVSAMMVLL